MKASPCCVELKHGGVGSGGCSGPGTVKGAGIVGRRALDVAWRNRHAFRTTPALKHTPIAHPSILNLPSSGEISLRMTFSVSSWTKIRVWLRYCPSEL